MGHTVLSLKGKFMAATLACGDGAVISHRAAAQLHGLLTTATATIDVSCVRRLQATGTIRPHQTRTLAPQDITTVDGIPATTVARTVLDLAAVAPQRHVERALHQAEILRVFDLAALDDVIARATGRRTKVLRAALGQHRQGPVLTRSELEEAFLALVDDAGLPRPAFTFHRARAIFESDRRRDIARQAAGLRTARFTDRRIAHDPEAVAHDLRRLVDSRPPRSS